MCGPASHASLLLPVSAALDLKLLGGPPSVWPGRRGFTTTKSGGGSDQPGLHRTRPEGHRTPAGTSGLETLQAAGAPDFLGWPACLLAEALVKAPPPLAPQPIPHMWPAPPLFGQRPLTPWTPLLPPQHSLLSGKRSCSPTLWRRPLRWPFGHVPSPHCRARDRSGCVGPARPITRVSPLLIWRAAWNVPGALPLSTGP